MDRFWADRWQHRFGHESGNGTAWLLGGEEKLPIVRWAVIEIETASVVMIVRWKSELGSTVVADWWRSFCCDVALVVLHGGIDYGIAAEDFSSVALWSGKWRWFWIQEMDWWLIELGPWSNCLWYWNGCRIGHRLCLIVKLAMESLGLITWYGIE